MKLLEIIHLRWSGEPIEALSRQITDSIPVGNVDAGIVSMYRRNGLVTDVAIHIQHHNADGEREPCALALHLANALREFGLVEHTVWEEMPSKDSGDRTEPPNG